jgi:cysteine desulfurase
MSEPKRPIYMDHHATTPVDPRVLEVMLPYFTECFGNAASVDHAYGAEAAQAVDNARSNVARVIGARPDEIIFTSGATESDNLAIMGTAERSKNGPGHIVSCVTEHKAVLDSCAYLQLHGWDVTLLPVDQFGLVDPDDVRRAIRQDTALISIMAANNEIGTIGPISEIGRIAKEAGVLFHTDATQAVGYIPVDVDAMGIDLLSLSGHKIYGPKGIGALYVRKSSPRVRVVSRIHGGGHERGMRSGTLNVPGIVGLAEAAKIAIKEMPTEVERLRSLRDQLWEWLQERIEGIQLNGHPTQRLPHNLSVAIPGIESRSLIVQLRHDVAISTGSACTTAKVEPSHVILALGFGEERVHSSLRFGLGRGNDPSDVGLAIIDLAQSINSLRVLSNAS